MSLSRLPFQLMFWKKLLTELLQSDPFQLEHQLAERFLLSSLWMKQDSSHLGRVCVPLMSQFVAGREAMCSFFWCDNKRTTSWVRHCNKSYFNSTKQIQSITYSFMSLLTSPLSVCALDSGFGIGLKYWRVIFQLLYFEQDVNGGYGLALQVNFIVLVLLLLYTYSLLPFELVGLI